MTVTSAALSNHPDEVANALVRMSQAELDATYAGGQTGPIPHGHARGVACLFPGSGLTPLLAKMGYFIWQGKNFDAQNKTLVNRVFGLRLIPAKLSLGPSWFDSGDAVIVDYKDTSFAFSYIRDEIRLIAPDYWLGRSYYQRGGRGPYVLSFGLAFGK
jgi:hypothetical protein